QRLLAIFSKDMMSDPYAAVREYVSNAYDASRKYPNSSIRVSCDDKRITIEDRGCGMTDEVIRTAFTRIGGRLEVHPEHTVGKFGLGVLAAFMISEELVVETRSEQDDQGWRLVWKHGQQRFSLRPIARSERGTTATLHLADDYRDMADEAGIRDYIERVFGL